MERDDPLYINKCIYIRKFTNRSWNIEIDNIARLFSGSFKIRTPFLENFERVRGVT